MEQDDNETTTSAETYPSPMPGQVIEATFISLQAATEGSALSMALGIALPSGIACIVLPEDVNQKTLREQVEKLSTYDEVIGFSYVAVAPTLQRKLKPGEGFSEAFSVGGITPTGLLDPRNGETEQTGYRLVIAAITRRNGRLVRIFDTVEVPGSEEVNGVINREVSSEPTIESPIFLSPIFEGIWEVAQ